MGAARRERRKSPVAEQAANRPREMKSRISFRFLFMFNLLNSGAARE
jgi:hypothetical protein